MLVCDAWALGCRYARTCRWIDAEKALLDSVDVLFCTSHSLSRKLWFALAGNARTYIRAVSRNPRAQPTHPILGLDCTFTGLCYCRLIKNFGSLGADLGLGFGLESC